MGSPGSPTRFAVADKDGRNLLACKPINRRLVTRNLYPAGNLFIPAEHGQLEAILKEPSGAPHGVALVLHPHPLGGGTMHTKVVFRAAQALNDAGLIALRINFRGVGQSTGTHDDGRGELEDVRAGLNYLAQNYPGRAITLCGFSFGSRVGCEVGIEDSRVSYLISIGTPVDKYDFDFLRDCRKPILFVHGTRDEFGDANRLRELVSTIHSAELVMIAGADHFFEGRLDELKIAIKEWMTRQLEGVAT